MEQLKREVAGKDDLVQLNDRLDDITTSIQKASERGQELKAKILLPPSELMNVQLVPSHSLERLEEYRSDEKKTYVLLGCISWLRVWHSFKLGHARHFHYDKSIYCLNGSIYNFDYWTWDLGAAD